MANRRSPDQKPLSNPTPRYRTLARRKYELRRLAKHPLLTVDSHGIQVATSPASRPVLVPLHPNLRRLPSRLMALARGRDEHVSVLNEVKVGAKRKRVASANENTYILSRPTRTTGRFKRQRSQNDSSDDDFTSSHNRMDIDIDEGNRTDWLSEASEAEEVALDDSDDFLIHHAGVRQLSRLRKDELVRLSELAGLTELDDATKSDIINAIITSRNDRDLPPSSPPGHGHSSGYSSDDGHDAGGEETDAAFPPLRNGLRRRVTVQDIGRAVQREVTGRTFSLAFEGIANGATSVKKSARIAKDVKSPSHLYLNGSTRRRGMSSHSSPTTSSNSTVLPSPPTTRLRSRTVSAESSLSCGYTPSPVSDQSSSLSSSQSRRMNRTKQVDFEDTYICYSGGEEHQKMAQAVKTPSPRRLRSKKMNSISSQERKTDVGSAKKRVTPMRRAKSKVVSLKEDSTADEEDEEEPAEQDEDVDEVDELDSSPSSVGTPEPRQRRPTEPRTPLKKRLRPRKIQDLAPSDGDDECDEEEEAAVSKSLENEEDVEVDEEESGTSTERGDESASDDEEPGEQITPEPRRLRNGKVVGEEIVAENDDEDDTSSNSASEIEMNEKPEDADENGQTEDEEMEDEFDLSTATKTALVRLRRDDLVRLCESRDLEVEGTKPQLAQALLEWRDKQCYSISAPSSSSTARPPSIMKMNGRRRRTSSKSSSATPPVLLRSERVHDDEPVTPPISRDKKDGDGDLELDLESLGLEDREIPPEKLTKLEKIGSGGFKDVFIGKLRGRKVAIAEFRDQLSAMDIKELKLLAEFAHPNIVRFLGVSIPENTKETPVMIVSELCSNGDLFDYVRNVAAPSLYKVLNMMLDIARGLQYLHERKPSVIHRDCKSSNILITSKGTAKIADFGLAKVKQSTRSMVRSLVGTVNWQAPELWVAHPKYNHKVDVYSCACVYWEMLQWHNPNKKFPWEGMNEHAIYEAVGQKRQRPSVAGLRKQWCPQIVDLLEQMWAQDPQDRPSIAEVVEGLGRIIRDYR